MSKMYVANGTHKNVDFQYRLPEYKNYRQQMIPIGGQQQLSGELNEKQIDIIIQFHRKYGIVKYSEISDFKGYFIPYVYSIDTSVPAEAIAELIIQNREYNKVLGERIRAEAAIAVNAMIEENASDQLASFEVEITEKQSKDRDPTISEKITITRDEKRGAPQGPSKGPLGVVADFIRRPQVKKSVF
jgi:hypothetical protein